MGVRAQTAGPQRADCLMYFRLLRLVLRWVGIPTLVRFAVRVFGRRSIARTRTELEAKGAQKLGPKGAQVIDALPSALKDAGAAAMAGANVSKVAAGGVTTVAKGSQAGVRRLRRAAGAPQRRWRSIGVELSEAVEDETRRLRSEYLAAAGDLHGATDALLDARVMEQDGPSVDDLHEQISPPVIRGRRRFRRPTPPAPVARVSRRYRRPGNNSTQGH